ncbi:hypothetical protein ACIRBX_08150 [Kitasatospora sp. NPDC096147]|uniref:hypothetical protein n=1 Tax=Kitasatospora sp. NPDC096147 TaxID=3364093 RepID=UPI00382D46BD
MTDHQLPSGDSQLEEELRSRLHRAVARVEPAPTALPRLRQEVPRRRARHRTLWTTAAAAVLLSAAAWPTIQGVQGLDLSGGPVETPTASASAKPSGSVRPSRSGAGRPAEPAPQPAQPSASPSLPAESGSPSAGAVAVPSAGTSGATAAAPSGPVATPTPATPACTTADLGRLTAGVGQPDAAGNVYGWFRVQNVSGRACVLTGGGVVNSDRARIRVTGHTAGGPATALPAPSGGGPLLLAPSAAYLVRFGWVPETACPAAPSPAPSTAPAAESVPVKGEAVPAGAAVPGPSGTGAPSEAPGAEPTPSPSPSPSPTAAPESTTLLLTHVPDPGGQSVSAAVPNACSGTVYRTAPEAEAQPAAGSTP